MASYEQRAKDILKMLRGEQPESPAAVNLDPTISDAITIDEQPRMSTMSEDQINLISKLSQPIPVPKITRSAPTPKIKLPQIEPTEVDADEEIIRELTDLSQQDLNVSKEQPTNRMQNLLDAYKKMAERRSTSTTGLAMAEAADKIGGSIAKYYGAKPSDNAAMYNRLRAQYEKMPSITEKIKESSTIDMADPKSKISSIYQKYAKEIDALKDVDVSDMSAYELSQAGVSIPKKELNALTAYQAARIQERQLDRAQREKKQDVAEQKQFRSEARSALKDLRATETWKNAEKAFNAIEEIDPLLEDAYRKGGQSLAMLGPRIAKGIAGEVGVLTERDVTRYVQNPTLIGSTMDTAKKISEGKITDVSYQNLKRLLDIVKAESLRKRKEAISNEAILFSRRNEIPVEDAMMYLDSQYGKDGMPNELSREPQAQEISPKDKAALEWVKNEKNKSHKSYESVVQKLKDKGLM